MGVALPTGALAEHIMLYVEKSCRRNYFVPFGTVGVSQRLMRPVRHLSTSIIQQSKKKIASPIVSWGSTEMETEPTKQNLPRTEKRISTQHERRRKIKATQRVQVYKLMLNPAIPGMDVPSARHSSSITVAPVMLQFSLDDADAYRRFALGSFNFAVRRSL